VKLDLGPRISRMTMSDEVISRFKDLISRRVLVPGEKLPPERTLAEAMDVSRPTLRQGLRALQILGVIRSRQGSGSYLSDQPSDILKAPLEFALAMKGTMTDDMFEARFTMELKLAELAAQRRTDADLAEMRGALDAMQAAMGKPELWCKHEIRFHEAIVQAARNSVMATMMEMLSHLLLESRKQTVLLLNDYPRSYRLHDNVFQAIEAGDPARAAAAMVEHFSVLAHMRQARALGGE
jgi:GntR family transcriptional repressor for pyruvate dehydrogenase complex